MHQVTFVLKKLNLIEINGFWQLLLDDNGLPATKPPWGGLVNISMESGKISWKIPFGNRLDKNGKLLSNGDKNFGGVLTTKSNIIFATGTPDKMARAYDLISGKLLWEYKLPFAGSSPPMTYKFKGCQYVVFTATGGQFVGYEKEKGDLTIAFKLSSCKS